ncbi:MAG: hypothetical protein J5887_04340 [Erysipelotrichaceae bacterium]|nr:hypothetical protein [Erysipelotrichaceae bacterium]
MKKILCVMLALMMLAGFVPDTQAASVPNTYQEYQVSDQTRGIKVLGVRHLQSDECIYMDYTCSGVEFKAVCNKGRMEFSITADDNCMFKIYVDNKLVKDGKSSYFTVPEGDSVIGFNIRKGTHTVRLVKVTHYRLAKTQLNSITFKGYIVDKKPANKKIYVEFIGDSLCCGWGITNKRNGKFDSVDGTLAYPYLVASSLKADYSVFALSGQGAYCGNPSVQDCYLKASYERGDEEYSFSRKADVVVINLGTNDYTNRVGEEQFKEALLNIIAMVRLKNGEKVKILLVYNIKNDGYSEVVREVAKQENTGILKCARSKNRKAYYHPTYAESKKYAKQIVSAIKKLMKQK